MNSLIYLLVWSLTRPTAAAQSDTKPTVDFQAAAHWFDYDSKQPLDLHDRVIEQFNGGTLHDITYTSHRFEPGNRRF